MFIIFLTGIDTPDTPTIATTPPVVTTPPPPDPLEVYFANNTPHVVGNTVTVQVHTNNPASATCRLGRVATMPCKQLSQYCYETVKGENILVDFNLAVSTLTTKSLNLNSLSNFPAIWYHIYALQLENIVVARLSKQVLWLHAQEQTKLHAEMMS